MLCNPTRIPSPEEQDADVERWWQSAACDEPLIPSCTWLQAAVSMSDLGASVWMRSMYARELGSAARYEYKLTRLHDTDKVPSWAVPKN